MYQRWCQALVFALLSSAAATPLLAAPPHQGGIECAREYTVVPGDWLVKIARMQWGNGGLYPAIVTATNEKHAEDTSFAQIPNPRLIRPGWKLCLVDAETAQTLRAAPRQANTPTAGTGGQGTAQATTTAQGAGTGQATPTAQGAGTGQATPTAQGGTSSQGTPTVQATASGGSVRRATPSAQSGSGSPATPSVQATPSGQDDSGRQATATPGVQTTPGEQSSVTATETPIGFSEETHWAYTGKNGPDAWGRLAPEFALCATGRAQSPIDLADPTPTDLANIVFRYQPTKLNIMNNGHTIQTEYDSGSRITLDGTDYQLIQFHFHAPSEHTIAGQPLAMELHLVHKSADDALAVVGVMIEEGAENEKLAPLWEDLPPTEGPVRKLAGSLNIADVLPTERLTYRYRGSLTTPPCSENVQWLVLTTPIEMSGEQLAAYKAIFEDNNRPTQPLNERELVEDTSAN